MWRQGTAFRLIAPSPVLSLRRGQARGRLSSFAVDGRLAKQQARTPISMPNNADLAAARVAAAEKFKTKKPSAKTLKVYERAATAAEKKAVAAEAAAAEAKEGALGANAIEAAVAAEAVAATACEARARATKARARLTAASAPSERHAASGHLGNEAQINGTVKRVKPSRGDEAAHREAKLVLTLEQVALQEMREQGRGWVCALWVGERLHVYLAGDLAGENPVIRKVVVGGGKEGAQVRMDVDKDRLESQPMVVMKEQKFFYVDTAGLGPFDGVGKGRGEGDCGCCTEKQQPDVRCRRSTVVFLPFSVGRDVVECKRLLKAGKEGGVFLEADVKADVEGRLGDDGDAPPWLGEWGHSVAHCRGDGACSCVSLTAPQLCPLIWVQCRAHL